jgi:glutaredoxin 3
MEFLMVPVVIYTREGCGYCDRARGLLKKKSIAFNEINAGYSPELKREMVEKSGRSTFPQIFVGSVHVGGCDDLHALENTGRLDALLTTGKMN